MTAITDAARVPTTVHDAFAATVRAHPDAVFLCLPARADRPWLPAGFEWTYHEVHLQVERLSRTYAAAGYGSGMRVAMLLGSRPEFFIHFLALNALGVSVVPINPDYRHEEMLFQMEHSDACLAIVLPERMTDLEQVSQARFRMNGMPLPVVNGLDTVGLIEGGVPHAADLLGRNPPEPPAIGSGQPTPGLQTEASLLYTSGTTGRPKGCRLSNFYHLNAGSWYLKLGHSLTLGIASERIYNPLPLHHMNAFAVTATCTILSANCFVLVERFSAQRWWPEVVQSKATVIHYLGIVAPTLLNQPISNAERQHQVRFGLGAGIEPSLHEVFERRFGFPMVEVWGMTETGRIFADHIEPRATHTRAFGRPLPELQARVVDDRDQELPRGSAGELVVRHNEADPKHGFFSGYLKNQAATDEAWRGGWFHTGDQVVQDESGMLYFIDRKKHIIRRSGENIAPAEIEAVLQAHEAVAQVAVLAAPDEVREEEVLACVVVMPGVHADTSLARELFDWTFERLAYFKAPGWILFLNELPTTGTQKVQKTQIFAAGEDPRRRADVHDFRALKKRH